MTAKQIAALTAHISFKDRSAKPDVPQKALLYAICLPILIFFITLCTFFQTVATGILNSEKYVSSDTPYTHEITTVTEIGDAVSDGTKVCVFYDKIGAANVYDVNGSFLYSVSLPHSVFKHTAITFSEGRLLYRYGDEVLAYRTDGVLIGSEPYTDGHAALFVNEQNAACFDSNGAYCNGITVTERASVLALFTPSVVWPINMMLILALFMLRYYVTKDDHKLSVD